MVSSMRACEGVRGPAGIAPMATSRLPPPSKAYSGVTRPGDIGDASTTGLPSSIQRRMGEPRQAARSRCRRLRSPNHRGRAGQVEQLTSRLPRPWESTPSGPIILEIGGRASSTVPRCAAWYDHTTALTTLAMVAPCGASKASRSVAWTFTAVRPAKTFPLKTTITPRPALSGSAATAAALSRFAGPSHPCRSRSAWLRSWRQGLPGPACGPGDRHSPREYRCHG